MRPIVPVSAPILGLRFFTLVLIAPLLAGCSTGQPPELSQPSTTELAQIQAKNLEGIKHDPTLTDAQKAERIRALTDPPPP